MIKIKFKGKETMTFSDIFKSSFLENITGVSLLDMGITLLLSFAIGLFIFLFTRKPIRGSCIPPASSDSRRSDHDNLGRNTCRHLKRGAFPRHGGHPFHRPFPHRHKGAP